MLGRQAIVKLVLDNMASSGNPLGVTSSNLSFWSSGLSKPASPDSLLYTGQLYPLLPYMKRLSSALASLDSSKLSGIAMGLSSAARRLMSLVADKKLASRTAVILGNAVKLLRASGYSPTYNPEEPYSGVLLYDLGLLDEFKTQAERVIEYLESSRANLIVTVDPHTTYALKELYPRYVGKTPEVKHVLELVDESVLARRSGTLAVHDPCYLSAKLRLHENLRRVLRASGFELLEPLRSREKTFCCGGPLETLFPKLSGEIACRRARQLASLSEKAVIACPVCLANLSRGCGVRLEVYDWLELVEAKKNA